MSSAVAIFVPSFGGKTLAPFTALTRVIENQTGPSLRDHRKWTLENVKSVVGQVPGAVEPMWESVRALFRLRECEPSAVEEEDKLWMGEWEEHVCAWLVSSSVSRWSLDQALTVSSNSIGTTTCAWNIRWRPSRRLSASRTRVWSLETSRLQMFLNGDRLRLRFL